MSAVYFIYFGAVGAMTPYLTVYLHNIGLTGTQIGLLMSIQPVLLCFSQPVVGPLSDRSGHRGRMLARLLVLTGLAGFLMVAGRSFWSMLPLITLWSLFAGLIVPISDSIALFETAATGVSYTRLRLWGSIGYALVVIGMGWIYTHISLDWSFPIYGLLIMVSVYFARRLPAEGAASRQPVWGELWGLIKNPQMLAFLLLCAVVWMTQAANSSFFSVHLTAVGGSNRVVGLGWGILALFEVPMWLVLPRISRKVGALPLLAFAAMAYATRWWAYSVITNPNLLVAMAPLQSFSFAVFMPTSVIFIGEVTPPHLRTSGQALLGLVTLGLATLAGTYWSGTLVDRLGTAGMYHVMSWVALSAGAGFLLLILARFRPVKKPVKKKEVLRVG